MFYLKLGIFCVAKTASHGWQRCRIVQLHTKNVCTVFLVDVGLNEHIAWMDLRLLDEKWCHQRPFANRCALIRLTSACPIDRVTRLQQQQFKKTLQAHENFHIFVNRPGTISSDIFLYYKLNDEFRCVNTIFPSGFSSTDDDDDGDMEEKIGAKMPSQLHASGDGGAGDALIRHTGSTFNVLNEQSSNHFPLAPTEISKSASNVRTMPDIELNETSQHDAPKLLEHQRLSKPETVLIRHIDEIGSIYVCFQRYNRILNMLRFKISEQIKETAECDGNTKNNEDVVWNVGDYCLVKGRFDGFTEWLRAKVTHMSMASDSETLARVYLRDVGKSVGIGLHELKPIQNDRNDCIRTVRDFTWKTRLALIEIGHREGSPIAKILTSVLNDYDEIAMSVLDSSGDQFNGILWGIKRNTRVLLPERIQLFNINEELVKQGHAVTDTSPSTFECINKCIAESMNIIAEAPTSCCAFGDNLTANYVVDDRQMDVDQWLRSEPIYQCEFPAFPMHVTHKLVLSVLEANRKAVADQIKTICEKKFKSNELVRRDAVDWKKDDPCFVRFKCDGRFYRGSVRRVNFGKGFCVVSKFICTCTINQNLLINSNDLLQIHFIDRFALLTTAIVHNAHLMIYARQTCSAPFRCWHDCISSIIYVRRAKVNCGRRRHGISVQKRLMNDNAI